MNIIIELDRSLQAELVENYNSLLTKLWVEVRISQQTIVGKCVHFWKQKFNSIEQLMHEYIVKTVVDNIVCGKDT